jgi:hypothetical protein
VACDGGGGDGGGGEGGEHGGSGGSGNGCGDGSKDSDGGGFGGVGEVEVREKAMEEEVRVAEAMGAARAVARNAGVRGKQCPRCWTRM